MTGYESKRAAARDKLITVKEHGATKYAHLLMVKCFTEEYDKHRRTTMDDDDDTQVYQDHDDALTIAYQSGYYDGKKAAQTTQEPVAYLCGPDENGLFGLPTADKACKACFPVYRQSPQRPWIGLTQDEPMQIWDGIIKYAPSEMRIKDFAQAIEAKLKEKNNGTTP
jgi:hypothetical protein